MITTVIFDLDDTLYDEIDYCRSGFAAVARYLAGLGDYPDAAVLFTALDDQFTTGNHTTTFNAALDRLGVKYDDKLIAELIRLYRNHVPSIELPPDSKQVLNLLVPSYTLALLTDGFMPAQQLKVRALGIEHYFRCIIYTEQLGREFWKPSPAGFEKLIRELNASPGQMAYVADNDQKDFIAPNKLGLATIKVVRPHGIHTRPAARQEARSSHTIHGIEPLPDLLARL